MGGGADQQVDYLGNQIGVSSTLGFPPRRLSPLLPLSSSPRPTPSLGCVGSGCGLPSFQGGHGGGALDLLPWFLWTGFHRPEIIRGVETSWDLSSSQQVPVDLPFWRETPFCWGLCPPRTLDDVHRPFGCLLSHPHSPSQQMWLRFVWWSRVFQFRALPFGLGPAPWIFNKVGSCASSASEGRSPQGLICVTGWSWPPQQICVTGTPRQYWSCAGDWTAISAPSIRTLPFPTIHLPGHPLWHGPLAGLTSASLGPTTRSLHLPASASSQCPC